MTTHRHAEYLRTTRLAHLVRYSDREFERHVLADVRAHADTLPEEKRALLLDLAERFRDLVDVAEHDNHACPTCRREWVADAAGLGESCEGCRASGAAEVA